MASIHCLVVAVVSAFVLIGQMNVYLHLILLEVVLKKFAIVLFLILEGLVTVVWLATICLRPLVSVNLVTAMEEQTSVKMGVEIALLVNVLN